MAYIEKRLESLERLVTELQMPIVELQAAVLPEKRNESAPETLSIAETSELLGKQRNTIAGWVCLGRLPVERVGREMRIKRDDLLVLVEESK